VTTHTPFALQENDSGTLDTVGAVVVDHEGNVAAAVSSGGLALKHPGRVGQVSSCGVLKIPFQNEMWNFSSSLVLNPWVCFFLRKSKYCSLSIINKKT
jgi:hypothetical protein